MSWLSWLIYLADISGRMSGALNFFAIATMIIWALGSVFTILAKGTNDPEATSIAMHAARPIKVSGYASVFIWVIATLTPSSDAVYRIAASEAAAFIVNNPDARDLFTDLKLVIKKKLQDQLLESTQEKK